MSIPAGVPLSEIPSLQPPPGVTPNFINPPTIAPALIAVNGVFLALMLVAAGTIVSGPTVQAGSIAHTGVIIEQTKHGYGKHLWDVPLSVLTKSDVHVLLAENVTGQPTTFLIKLSIMLLYFRIFAVNQTMRYWILGGIGLQVVVYTATTACAIALESVCTAESAGTNSFCVNQYKNTVFQAVFSFTTDLYVLVLPIKSVLNLQLSPRRRIGVMILFGTGLIACVASLVRLISTIQQEHLRDSTYQGAYISIFTAVEMNTGIIAGSLTTLPTFLKKSGIASFNLSTLESLRTQLFTRSKDPLDDGSTKSNTFSKNPFKKSDMHLHGDNYIKLGKIKVTSLDKPQHNASQNDVETDHSNEGIFRTDEFDVAYSGNGRMKENNGR
ncbi:hypothetical protein HO133_009009 [Letharia lupina]|uniref:Rhodopsin domain-containing protein n=1 Tax=Letharia lupina TaxID=560253 RepID=A0A8H6FFP2_9LECA|nr:uncharacterized protein HO133_009009 [Letharia lupina]KAF6226143.1 hypothetical protein HO133_009009 [Letharia lupina]